MDIVHFEIWIELITNILDVELIIIKKYSEIVQINNCTETAWVAWLKKNKQFPYYVHYMTSLLGVDIPNASSYPVFFSCLPENKVNILESLVIIIITMKI